MMGFLTWLVRLAARPHAGRVVIAIALLLSAPALAAPLVADEHLQAVRWHEEDLAGFLQHAFVFASGDADEARARMEHLGTWWAPPDFRVAFFRPLAAATHALDLWLFPDGAVLMHAHTLLWLAALLFVLDALYRRFLPPSVAVLALALFAWDDARGGLLSWVANRHALIAACFGAAALIAHDRWRREGWRPGAWLGPALFATALAASESALGVVGLFGGHAVFVDREGSLGRRLLRLAPYLVLLVAWQAAYAFGGYGVVASGSYVHPLEDPLGYLSLVPARAGFLALGQLTFVASDFALFYPPAVRVAVLVGAVLFLGAVARVVGTRLTDPGARALAFGAVLSLLPAAAAAPGDRNLTMVGIGASAALAVALEALTREGDLRRGVRWIAGTLIVSNLVLAPLFLPLKCLANFNLDAMRAATDEAVSREASVADQTLVVVSVASEGSVFFAWASRDAHGIPTPRGTRILSTGLGTTTVTRLDERTLRVEPEGGFLSGEMQQLMRSASRPFHVGDEVELSDMRARRGEGMTLVPWTPPAVGETVVVPSPF